MAVLPLPFLSHLKRKTAKNARKRAFLALLAHLDMEYNGDIRKGGRKVKRTVISNGKQFMANKNYVLREIAGNTVLVSVGGEIADFCGIVNLNPSAKVLWKALLKPVTEEELKKELLDKFGVSEERAGDDVKKVLGMLKERGMVHCV